MLSSPAKLSSLCFLFSLLGTSAPAIPFVNGRWIFAEYLPVIVPIFAGSYLFINSILVIFYISNGLSEFSFQISLRACFLGAVFSGGLFTIFVAPELYLPFGCYVCIMSFFHFSEFVAIAITNQKTLSVDSFMLNHSTAYKVAAVASWIEFFIELWLYPDMKSFWMITLVGLILCIGGEAMRKVAMLTAQKNFTHVVQTEKSEGHRLVTHGVYSICRHPSYAGWFFWAVGTQMVLLNPVCFIGYLIASWRFFNDRIIFEEITLLNFFGAEYHKYQQKVPTGLPFIRGYQVDMK